MSRGLQVSVVSLQCGTQVVAFGSHLALQGFLGASALSKLLASEQVTVTWDSLRAEIA